MEEVEPVEAGCDFGDGGNLPGGFADEDVGRVVRCPSRRAPGVLPPAARRGRLRRSNPASRATCESRPSAPTISRAWTVRTSPSTVTSAAGGSPGVSDRSLEGRQTVAPDGDGLFDQGLLHHRVMKRQRWLEMWRSRRQVERGDNTFDVVGQVPNIDRAPLTQQLEQAEPLRFDRSPRGHHLTPDTVAEDTLTLDHRTSMPSRANVIANDEPASPPPTTTTSKLEAASTATSLLRRAQKLQARVRPVTLDLFSAALTPASNRLASAHMTFPNTGVGERVVSPVGPLAAPFRAVRHELDAAGGRQDLGYRPVCASSRPELTAATNTS